MAGREAKERNKVNKGKTGPKTVKRRKKLGMKARPTASSTKATRLKQGGRK